MKRFHAEDTVNVKDEFELQYSASQSGQARNESVLSAFIRYISPAFYLHFFLASLSIIKSLSSTNVSKHFTTKSFLAKLI